MHTKSAQSFLDFQKRFDLPFAIDYNIGHFVFVSSSSFLE